VARDIEALTGHAAVRSKGAFSHHCATYRDRYSSPSLAGGPQLGERNGRGPLFGPWGRGRRPSPSLSVTEACTSRCT
jgi:hypothetical protein